MPLQHEPAADTASGATALRIPATRRPYKRVSDSNGVWERTFPIPPLSIKSIRLGRGGELRAAILLLGPNLADDFRRKPPSSTSIFRGFDEMMKCCCCGERAKTKLK